MTEAEWLACDDLWRFSESLLCPEALGLPNSDEWMDRRIRLVLIAALRAVWPCVTDHRSRTAVEASERYADERAPSVLEAAYSPADHAMDEAQAASAERGGAHSRVAAAAWDCLETDLIEYADWPFWVRVLNGLTENVTDLDHSAAKSRAFHVALVRDIFGNPFRPAPFSPNWRTDTARALAARMYEARDFSAMPILADALQDAGCDSDDILDHCRDPNATHVRGCWVVDLVLGKE